MRTQQSTRPFSPFKILILLASPPPNAHNTLMTQTGNPTAYAASGRFVANLATAVVDLLAPDRKSVV